jgi:hypothetical protein
MSGADVPTYTRFYEYFWAALPKSLFFIVGGATLSSAASGWSGFGNASCGSSRARRDADAGSPTRTS